MVCFSFFFYSFISIFFFIAVKNILKHTILYVHCVDLLIWSLTQLNFLFYDFSVIYYDFSKLRFRGNLTDFEKFRRWYRPFHRLGVMYSTLHRWGGYIDFFPIFSSGRGVARSLPSCSKITRSVEKHRERLPQTKKFPNPLVYLIRSLPLCLINQGMLEWLLKNIYQQPAIVRYSAVALTGCRHDIQSFGGRSRCLTVGC